MGCQTAIAEAVVAKKADYVLAVKENQPTLYAGIEAHFLDHLDDDKMSARSFGAAVRGHWSIENRLRWQLDVTFGEDHCRTRKGRADANFSILRRTALSWLKNEKTAKVGMKNKRLTAAWNDRYLEKVLCGT